MCANKTCARTVRVPGEYCDQCGCFFCNRKPPVPHVHIKNTHIKRDDDERERKGA